MKWPGLQPGLGWNRRSFWTARIGNGPGLACFLSIPARIQSPHPTLRIQSGSTRRGEGDGAQLAARGEGRVTAPRTGGELVLRRLLTSKPPPSSSLPSSLPSARFLLGFPVRSIPTKGGDEAERRGGSGSAGAVLPPSTAIGDGL